MMFYASIGLTVIANVLYHVFQKFTPSTVNPFLSLAVTYFTAGLVCVLLIPTFPLEAGLAAALRQIRWPSYALAFAVLGLEVGFLLAYRAGWAVSIGPIVSNVAVGMLLVPVGLLLFREGLSATNLVGIGLCLAGLALVNWK